MYDIVYIARQSVNKQYYQKATQHTSKLQTFLIYIYKYYYYALHTSSDKSRSNSFSLFSFINEWISRLTGFTDTLYWGWEPSHGPSEIKV